MPTQLVNLAPTGIPANPWIRLHPSDNVAVARVQLPAGAEIEHEGIEVTTSQAIAPGHKIALRRIGAGETVYKYGEEIGRAGADLAAGEWVHTHNLRFDINERQYEFGTTVANLEDLAPPGRNTFLGYPRSDGRAGTRNYIAIVGASHCAAYATERIADAFRDEEFAGRVLMASSPCRTSTVAVRERALTCAYSGKRFPGWLTTRMWVPRWSWAWAAKSIRLDTICAPARIRTVMPRREVSHFRKAEGQDGSSMTASKLFGN